MIRKLWLELRLIFPILPLFLIAITLEYTWAIQHAKIMVYNDQSGYGLYMSPNGEGKQDEVATFLKEHPQGQVISLKDTPQTYLSGFDAIARNVLPFLVVALCVGGIMTEKSSGTASFVLSFPVSRASWLWSRAAALLILTLVMSFLACIAAFILAARMEIDSNWSWLLTDPILLTIGAAPWIGISLYVQSWLSGRFDATSETIIGAALTMLVIYLTDVFAGVSPAPSVGNFFFILMDAAKSSANHVAWKPLLGSSIVGVAAMLLAHRRFQQMDF